MNAMLPSDCRAHAQRPHTHAQTGSMLDVDVTSVTCGAYHTVACCNNGVVVGFGSGEYGQLGTCARTWDDACVRSPQPIIELTGALQVAAHASGAFTAAIL
eukprot:m.36025 g.36025  ORF g.36025 m.36025 type:complete len:101 (+) comp9950_c0_seq2:1595-1897(+)